MIFDKINVSIPKKQGNLGVARAIYEYYKLGYTVCAPLSDSDKYDLIIDDGISLKRVQVKTSRNRSKYGAYNVTISTRGGNTKPGSIVRKRQENDYDILFILVEDGRCWSIPTSALGTTSTSVNVGKSLHSGYEM